MDNQANADDPVGRLEAPPGTAFGNVQGRNAGPTAAIVLAGVVLFGAIGGWLATRPDEPSAIEMIAPADIPSAIGTLTQGVAQNVRADYRGCRFPMGYVTV